jgi:hypothetical protein
MGSSTEMNFSVDCDFPGGNVIVERMDGDMLYLRQDLRDTEGWWFFWHFRVRGAGGRTLTFHFTAGDVIGTRGPAFSLDDGESWDWLGRDVVQVIDEGTVFRHTFAPDADDVRFCFTIPYLAADLDGFLEQYDFRNNAALQHLSLCHTRKGREVEMLRVGCLDREPQHRVLMTSRHHACESIATYSLEGVLAEVLAESEVGAWLRGNVEFFVVPFVDKDGVEDGDQGKNRRPHDHNRDYGFAGSVAEDSIYATTRALRERIPIWSDGKLRVALDLHCPWIRGEQHEVIHFVGKPNPENWARVGKFSEILESMQTGPLEYRATDNLPFGVSWNTTENGTQGRGFSRWAGELPDINIATSLEIPYANVRDVDVTADGARALGRDLARALWQYLRAL